MQITVFGAAGKVGSLVVETALRRGHTVVAFVHNHDLFSPSNQLIVRKGDVYDEQDVAAALRGSDAVLSCLGSWGTPKRNVLTAAMQAVVPAMHEQKINRIITLTGTGVALPGHKTGRLHDIGLKLLAPFPAGKVFHDGEEHLRLLAANDLAWTTICSPVMTGGDNQAYRLSTGSGSPLATVTRASVAAAMLDQLGSDEYLRKAAIVHRAP